MITPTTIDYDADALLAEVSQRLAISLAPLIAETGLWAHPRAHHFLVAENGTGAYYPYTRRYRASLGERPGTTIDGIRLDDNTYANTAIKQALGVAASGFETCHIWPRTTYDERYHTTLANLVLLPRPLAGLSDHAPAIRALLQYRAFALYGWHPAEEPAPTCPPDYPTTWREPLPFTPAIARTLARRRRRPPAAPPPH